MDIPSLVTEMTDTLSAIQSTLAALASAAPDHDQKLDELELRRDTTVRALLAAYAAESESLAQKRRQEREAIAAQRRREDEERERRRREEDEALAERERRQDEEREVRLRERTRGLEEEIDELMEEVEAGARRGAEEAVGRLKGLEGRRKELNQLLEEQLKVPPLPVWETRPRKTRGEVLPKALDLESIKAMGALSPSPLSPRLPSPRGMAVPAIQEPAAATENTRAMMDGQEEHSPVIPLYRVASHSDTPVSSFQQHDADEQNNGHHMDSEFEHDPHDVKIQVTDMSTFEDEDTMVAEEPHTTKAPPDTYQDSDKDSVYSDTSANDRQPTPHVEAKPSTSSTTVREVPSDNESSDLEYLPGAIQRDTGFHVDTEIPVEPAPTPVSAAAAAAAAEAATPGYYDYDDSSDSSDEDEYQDDEDDRHHHHHPVLETIQEDARVEDKWPFPPQGLHGVEYERDGLGVESPMMHGSHLPVHAPAEEEFVRDDDSVGVDSEEEGEKKEEKREAASPQPVEGAAEGGFAQNTAVDSHSDVDEEKPEEQPTIFASPMPIHGAAVTPLAPQDEIADLDRDVDEQHHQEQLDRGRSPLPHEFPTQVEDFAAPTSPNQDTEHPAAAEMALWPGSTNGELYEEESQDIGLGIQHQPVETPTVASPAETSPAAADDPEHFDDEREVPDTVPEATSYFPETKAPTEDHTTSAQDGHTSTASFTSPILNELDQDAEVSEDERERVLEKLKAAALASKVVDVLPDIGFGGLAISPRSARGSLADTFDRMVPVDEEYEDDDDLPVEETYSPEIKAVNFHNVDFGGGSGGPRSAVGSFVDPRSPVPTAEEFGGYDEDGDRPLGGLKAELPLAEGPSPGTQAVDIPDVDLRGLTPSPRSSFAGSRRQSKMGPAEEGEEVRQEDVKAMSPPIESNNDVHETERSEVEVHPRETAAISDSTTEDSDDDRKAPIEEPQTPLSPTHVESSAAHLFRAGNPDHRDDRVHFGDPSPMTSLAVELGNFTMANDDDSVDVDSPTAETADSAQRANVSPPPSPTINVDTPTMHASAVPEDLRDQSIDESLVKSIDESLEEVIRAKSPAVAADQAPSVETHPDPHGHGAHDSDDDEADTKPIDTYAKDAETSWGKPNAEESEVDNDKLHVATPPVEELVLTPTPSLKDAHLAASELSIDDRLNQAGHLLANSSSDEESDAGPYEKDRIDDPNDQDVKSPVPEHDAPDRSDLGPPTMNTDGGESPAFVTPLATADFRPDDAVDKHRNLADELEGADEDEDDGDYFDRNQDGHPSRHRDEEERSMDSLLARHEVTGVSPVGNAEDLHHDVHETEEMERANSPAADDHSPSPIEATTTSPKLNPQDTDADSDLDYATPLPLDTAESEAEVDQPTPLLKYSRPQTPTHEDAHTHDDAFTPRDVTNTPWSQNNNNTTSSPPHSVTSTGSTISSAPPSRTPSPHAADAHEPAIYQHHTPQSSGPMMARSRGASVLTEPEHHTVEEKAPGAVSSLWPGRRDSTSAPTPAPATTSVFQRMRNVFEHGVAAPIRTSVGGESIGGGGGSNRGSVIENSPSHGRVGSGGGGGLFGGYTVNAPPPVPSKEGLRRKSVGQGFFGGMGIGAGRRVDGREEEGEEGRGLLGGEEEGGR